MKKKNIVFVCAFLHWIAAPFGLAMTGAGVNDRHCERRKTRGNPVQKGADLSIKAFSLIELLISLMIVSIIIAAFAPVMTKKLKKQSLSVSSSLTTSCPLFGVDCKLCKKDKCFVCTKKCSNKEYLNVETCSCKSCSSLVANCEVCSNKGCISCLDGYGLNSSGSTSCSICAAGKYSNGNTACQTCPEGSYCTGGKKYPCAVGYYCTNGAKKPCSDFGSCSNCTSTSCLAAGCQSGFLNGKNCQACPNGFYCVNGSKINCSAFGANCTFCTQSGCTNCPNGVIDGGRCKTQTFDCASFGPNCVSCSQSGCTHCASGFKSMNYKGINYCTLDFGSGVVNQARFLQAQSANPSIRGYGDINEKCPDSFTPCCWLYNGRIVCNWTGALHVCGALGKGPIEYSHFVDFVDYFNTHQGNLDLRHVMWKMTLIDGAGLCYREACNLADTKCNYEKDFPFGTCTPFIVWGGSPDTYMVINGDNLGLGGYRKNIAASVICSY